MDRNHQTHSHRRSRICGLRCVSVSVPGLPFMVPAAFMYAAWAVKPNPITAPVGKISRRLAQVEGWVPHSLDEQVGGVCQRLLPLVVEPHNCDRRSKAVNRPTPSRPPPFFII
jgi:hypothetical protein